MGGRGCSNHKPPVKGVGGWERGGESIRCFLEKQNRQS